MPGDDGVVRPAAPVEPSTASAVDARTTGPAAAIRRATILVPIEPGTLQKLASTRTGCPWPTYGSPFRDSPENLLCRSTKTCAAPRSRWWRWTVEEAMWTERKPAYPIVAGPVRRTGPPSRQPWVSPIGGAPFDTGKSGRRGK
jgi:hypothetical protein